MSDVADDSKGTGEDGSAAPQAENGSSALEPEDGSAAPQAEDGSSALEPVDGSAADEVAAEPEGAVAPRRGSASQAWLVALTVTAITTAATFFAFQPQRAGTRSILIIVACPFLVLSAVTCLWLHYRGELRERLGLAGGDVSKGFVLAAVLYGAAVLANRLLTAKGSPREWWVIRAYLHVGDPTVAGVYAVGLSVLLIAACEEIVWRGLVMGTLGTVYRPTRAWLLSTALYVVAYSPTVMLLRDEFAGPNPLVVGAALVGGLVWGFIASRTGRLMPVVFAHALSTWAVVEYPVWRFLQ